MTKEQKFQKRLQLNFLKKLKISLNYQIQTLGMDKEKSEEDRDKEFSQLLEKLQAAEVEENKLRRNKLGSTFYSFTPHIGLNRKQKRNITKR